MTLVPPHARHGALLAISVFSRSSPAISIMLWFFFMVNVRMRQPGIALLTLKQDAKKEVSTRGTNVHPRMV
jgi:hypothetical protein